MRKIRLLGCHRYSISPVVFPDIPAILASDIFELSDLVVLLVPLLGRRHLVLKHPQRLKLAQRVSFLEIGFNEVRTNIYSFSLFVN